MPFTKQVFRFLFANRKMLMADFKDPARTSPVVDSEPNKPELK
jgi:hypothetical protein